MYPISVETLRTWLTEGRQVSLVDVSPRESWAGRGSHPRQPAPRRLRDAQGR
jgi:hypothetical protein